MTFGSVAVWRRWCSGRRRARPPTRLGALTSFGAAPRSPPVPSGPSGALHTSGAVSLCVAERVGSKPGQAPPPPTGTAARPTNPSGALHTGGAFGAVWCRPGPATHRHRAQASRPAPHPSFLSPQPISHAIPLRLLQVLNSDRWNCNVFQTLSKLHPIELHATFLEGRP